MLAAQGIDEVRHGIGADLVQRMDSSEPLYRDCAVPDLGKVNTEPLITRAP